MFDTFTAPINPATGRAYVLNSASMGQAGVAPPSSVQGAIDPETGRPYSFNPLDAQANGGLASWMYGDQSQGTGEYGGTTSTNSRLFNGAFNYSPEFLQSIGYSGDVYQQEFGENAGSNQANSPEFLQFLQDRGLRLASSMAGPESDQWMRGRAFDAQGNPVGAETRWRPDVNSDAFLGAILAGAGFAGSAVAGAGAAGAGEAGSGLGGGGITAEQAAYGALENGASYGSGFGNSLVASSESGFGGALGGVEGAAGTSGGLSSADLAALYGSEGYGGGLGTAGAAGATGPGGYLVSGASDASTAGGLGGYAGAVGSSAAPEALTAAVPGASTSYSLGGLVNGLGGYGSLINTGGQLVNGLISSSAARSAANAQVGASDRATDLQRDIWNQSRADWAPYRQMGTQAVGQINNLLANPNNITNDPGYLFQRDQGQQGIDRQAAARGGLYSGAQIKAASRFNSDYASTALDRALTRYGTVAQLGATGTAGTVAAGQNFGSQAGQNMIGAGNALAGASLYTANNWNDAINNGLANFNNSAYRRGGT